ncbi:hypothetical protein HTZ77_08420 [Nonomuraea sp. SMC257]|uniref:Uncharacterized protein n=1 Tax=Nonomuraea montanisoli TaxID=2741721 RepID=A0A7Y6I4A9_9ACTN|nr:hypothetical protein [Nonomuraea montanisoli]NUW31447.1 hypothetical protein [Nonomuraea montanisoli]
MADLPDDGRALAALCESFPRLVRMAASEGWSAELGEARRALREGERRPREVVDELSRMLGLDVLIRGKPVVPDLPSAGHLPPPPGGYRCPKDRCPRDTRPEPGGAIPACDVYELPLKYSPG